MKLLIMSGLLAVLVGVARADDKKPTEGAVTTPAAPAAAPSNSPFDGKTFSGKIAVEGKKKGDKDDLAFKDGKFTSSACTKYGFEASPYKVMTEGGKTMWESTAVNKKGEKMDWKGTLVDGKPSATAVYTNKKGKQTKYVWQEAKTK